MCANIAGYLLCGLPNAGIELEINLVARAYGRTGIISSRYGRIISSSNSGIVSSSNYGIISSRYSFFCLSSARNNSCCGNHHCSKNNACNFLEHFFLLLKSFIHPRIASQ